MSQFEMAGLPAGWATARIGDLVQIQYGKSLRQDERSGTGDVPVFGSGGQVGNHDRALHPGPSIIIGRKGTVGAVYYSPGPFWCIDTAFYIDDISPVVDIEFMAHMLRMIDLSRLSITVGVPGISRKDIEPQRIPLPPLPEQQRIVAILRKADDLRRLRRQANVRASELLPALFHEMFGQHVVQQQNWTLKPLSQFGDVAYGLTVNQERNKFRQKIPYLRVANVQRWKLDLREVAEIGVSGGDIERFGLQTGDLLIVEGHADPTEIGRAAVWSGELSQCLHQNHLLRIRPHPDRATSTFLMGYINSIQGRQHMLRYSKTSSGLNTINSSVLANMPVPDVPHSLQIDFENRFRVYERLTAIMEQYANRYQNLLQSILVSAFSGELTTIWRALRDSDLHGAAAERDRLLGIAQHVRRAEITATPDTNDQAAPEAASERSADVYPARHALLRSLSAIQDAVFRTLHSAARYMTVDALAEQAGISLKQVAHTIDLLVRAGVVQAVSIPTDPTGDQTVYVRAYRPVRDSDDARVQDINDLEALAA